MVNHVVARDELESVHAGPGRTRSPQKPLFALKLTKEAVNAPRTPRVGCNAMQTSFALHQLCHSHNQQVHGMPMDPGFTMPTSSRARS